jgi:hypothetical protein
MGRMHEWKGRLDPFVEGYPSDNAPAFKDGTGATVYPVRAAPAFAPSPRLTGNTTLGSVLTAEFGVLPADAVLTYKWYVRVVGGATTLIAGATAKTYTLAAPVVAGNMVSCEVTATTPLGVTVALTPEITVT